MKKALIGTLLIVLAFTLICDRTLLFAEFYQWTDENGTVHFSDGPANTPKGKPPIVRRDEMSISPSTSSRNQSTAIKPQKNVQQNTTYENNDSSEVRRAGHGNVADFDDSSLVAMWKSMVSCISKGDTSSALNYIHPRKRQEYKEIFATLKSKLPEIVSSQRNLKLIESGEKRAVYELTTSEFGGTYSHEIVFLKDDHKWWIYEY